MVHSDSQVDTHDVLFEHYRTIAYGRANPFNPEDFTREMDPSFGRLLPTDRGSRILDIGCGMGQFLSYLLQKGYRNVAGVELSAEQVEFCQQKVTPSVTQVSDVVSFLSERRESWDCIVFKDVIEHLPRPQVIPTLSAIFRALAPGGMAIVETGNLASPAGWFVRYIDFTHESGFTENSLRQVLRAVGFTEIEISGNAPVVYSWRSYFRIVAQSLWHFSLRLMYSLDRGWNATPRLLSPCLIARAVKSAK